VTAVWATKDGRYIPIDELSDPHLHNIIMHLIRRLEKWDCLMDEGYAHLGQVGEMSSYYMEQELRSLERRRHRTSLWLETMRKERKRREE